MDQTNANRMLSGARVARVRDGEGRVCTVVAREAEAMVLATDDVLQTVQSANTLEPIRTVPILDAETLELPKPYELLVPIVPPETWAAGVTYERSRAARMDESQVADVYELVYKAERPELFLKDAAGRRTVGPGDTIAVRTDATWTVPEPELAVVIGCDGPVAVTVANDVSARDIEGANPLYLPQAKIYGRACALGPALLVPESWDAHYDIQCRIVDSDGLEVFVEETSTDRMRRSIDELVDYMLRDNPVPAGSVLLTGTGLVPQDDVTLKQGYTVEIRIPGIGLLRNPVSAPANLSQVALQEN